jgi:hypothetical protein
VIVIHYEDTNGRLKQTFIGMPTEGVGVTGNPGGMPRFAGSVVGFGCWERGGGSGAVFVRKPFFDLHYDLTHATEN